ncbi:hypothetical protein BDN71DRAFT_1185615 [Pleurotus eryngii]|uniref:Fungal-type protein kinase domain-containing protein n=1 Tax=Pleurotus eryngii TaxID=5323 RepID=A0A9P6A8H9_PLEER|nr:hypothetical protein BDN71DRAFT_1185615 [Pleurotus eryngii]
MRAAIEGHKYLVSKGILHRDISAGNIMLSALANPPPGMEGFLTDLESSARRSPHFPGHPSIYGSRTLGRPCICKSQANRRIFRQNGARGSKNTLRDPSDCIVCTTSTCHVLAVNPSFRMSTETCCQNQWSFYWLNFGEPYIYISFSDSRKGKKKRSSL